MASGLPVLALIFSGERLIGIGTPDSQRRTPQPISHRPASMIWPCRGMHAARSARAVPVTRKNPGGLKAKSISPAGRRSRRASAAAIALRVAAWGAGAPLPRPLAADAGDDHRLLIVVGRSDVLGWAASDWGSDTTSAAACFARSGWRLLFAVTTPARRARPPSASSAGGL